MTNSNGIIGSGSPVMPRVWILCQETRKRPRNKTFDFVALR